MGKIGVPFFASRALLPLYTLVWTFTVIHLQVPLPLTRLKTAKETTYNLTPSTVYSQKVTGQPRIQSPFLFAFGYSQQPWEHGETCYFSGTKLILDVRSEGGCVVSKEKSFLHKMPKSGRGWATCCKAWPSPTPLEAKPLRIKVTFKPLDKFPA